MGRRGEEEARLISHKETGRIRGKKDSRRTTTKAVIGGGSTIKARGRTNDS